METPNDIARELVRFAPDAMIVVDERSEICFANDAVRDLLGYAPEELVGQPLEVLVPERLRATHALHVKEYMLRPRQREMGVRIPDLSARRRDGSEFPASIRLAPFRSNGKSYVAAAIRDITERTRINEALVAAREEADLANRAKSRFLATASHDLRQPLQTIRLLNAAMLRISQKPELRALLEQQNQAIESMTRQLNALLDISRLESGAIEIERTDVALADVFADLRSEFDSLARSRGLELRIEASDVVLETDRTLLHQILENLIANALKYTDAGSVAVRCSMSEAGVTISVEDTGVGIPEDKIGRIFDEYYQVDAQGAKRLGVGLGLAIVKEAARLLGYTISISSRQGEGTQARVTIPAAAIVARGASQAHSAPAASPPRRPTKARLVLIEDHPGVREATALFLKLEGFDVVSAGAVAEAEPALRELEPGDIVIADYHLDGARTGLDLLLDVRQRAGRCQPGVILTGDLPGVLRTVKTPVENCRFLSKPVDTQALLNAIAELGAAH